MIRTERICDLCSKEWVSCGAYKPAQMKLKAPRIYNDGRVHMRSTKIDVCGYCLKNIIETSQNDRKSNNPEQ